MGQSILATSYMHVVTCSLLIFFTLLLLGSASVALMERLWMISPVNRYACATLYLSTGNAAMERYMSKAMLSVQK